MEITEPDRPIIPESPRVAIVGGAGGMGLWMAKFFGRCGIKPMLIDLIPKTKEIASEMALEGIRVAPGNISEVPREHDFLAFEVVLISVPLNAVGEVVQLYAPLLKPGALLMDVTSVKVPPVLAIERCINPDAYALPTHPMFGPRVSTFKSQTCVIAESDRITAGPWRRWWEQLVTGEGGIIVEATPADHDQTMLVIQVLLHYMTLTFGITLTELPFNPSLLHAIKTPPFELMGPLLGRVFSGTPNIYFSIQRQAKASEVRSKVQSIARRLSDVIDAKDVAAFESLFNSVEDVIGESNLHAFEVTATEIFDYLNSKRTTFADSVGRAVCIRNIDSEVTHYGILKSVSPSSLSIHTTGGLKKLSTKRTRLLSERQAKEWAAKELTLDTAIVKFRCAEKAKPKIFARLLGEIDGLVDATLERTPSSSSPLQEMSFRLRIMPLAGDECDGSVKTVLTDLGCELLSWNRKRHTSGWPKK